MRGHDYAIFGGEDHKTGQVRCGERGYRRLEADLAARFRARSEDRSPLVRAR